MHNVQHSQEMLERGVCELAHFLFHFTLRIEGINEVLLAKQECISFAKSEF